MAKSSGRLVSLDIFRGFDSSFYDYREQSGSWEFVYAPLKHSKWNGCTPTDLVYPFFLFIAGMSMWYSLKKYGNEITEVQF